MTTDLSLDDSRAKLDWAKTQYNLLRRDVEAVEQADTHFFTAEPNAEASEYVFRVYQLPAVDPDWGLRIGDILHNARCALDYLAVRLYALGTPGVVPADVEGIDFPIYSDPGKFKGSVTAAEFRKNPVLSGWLTTIDHLQPYNAGNPSIWGWSTGPGDNSRGFPMLPLGLDRLGLLDNIDKHRGLLHAWHGRVISGYALEIPPHLTYTGSSTPIDPLVDGAVVARYNFTPPMALDWQPEQVDMKRSFPLQISFAEPSLDKSVTRILAWCLWSVEQVLTIFQPVFSHQRPPFPVTISLPQDDEPSTVEG